MKNQLQFTLLLLSVLLVGCSEPEQAKQEEIVRPVKVVDVTVKSDLKTFLFPAVVKDLDSKELTFQVSGQIESIRVREGQEVKQGEVISTLVQRNFINDLDTAQAQYDTAKLEFDQAERLIAERLVAKNTYDQKKAQLNVAEAKLDSAKKALEDTQLVSPFDGVIAVKHAKELQTVSPSQSIVTIQTEGAAEAVIKIPASLVSRSKQIEPVETVVNLDAAPEYNISAQMVAASTLADERSQTFEITLGFMPPEELTILPGMTGTVRTTLKFNSESDGVNEISIPLHAIVTNSQGQYVWVVNNETMRVSKRDVQVGVGVGEKVTIKSGLKEGEMIVGAGASYLTEGMKVRRMAN
jgi:RND family efflux transporter MFP subunit